MSDITLTLDTAEYVLSPAAYLYSLSDSTLGDFCFVPIAGDDDRMQIGQPFFNNFQVIFDESASTMQFSVGLDAATDVKIVDLDQGDDDSESDSDDGISTGAIAGIMAGCFVVLTLILAGAFYCYK